MSLIDLPPSPEIWLPPKPAIIRPADDLARYEASLGPLLCAARRRVSTTARTQGSEITGTVIGNINNLSFISDGLDDVANTSTASGNIAASAYGYVGYDLAAAKRVFSCDCYGPNNMEWFETEPVSMTIDLRASTGAVPSAPGTDGTSLGTVSFTSTTNEGSAGNGPRSITSNDQETLWDNVWMVVLNDIGGLRTFRVAEFDVFEAV